MDIVQNLFSSITNVCLMIAIVGLNVGFFLGKIDGEDYMEIVKWIVGFFFVKKGYEYISPTNTVTTDTTITTDTTTKTP